MSRAQQQALARIRKEKLQRILQHRHSQLASPDMRMQPAAEITVDGRDQEYRPAFVQQSRANALFRGKPQHAKAWRVKGREMPVVRVGEYVAAMRKFLDGLEGKVSVLPKTKSIAVPPRPEASEPLSFFTDQRTTKRTPRGSVAPTAPPQPSRASAVMQETTGPLRPSMSPKPKKSTVAQALQPSSEPLSFFTSQQTPRQIPRGSVVPAPPQPTRTSTVLPQRSTAPTPQPSRTSSVIQEMTGTPTPLMPNVSKKRKGTADDPMEVESDDEDDAVAKVAPALQSGGHKKARMNNELSKYNLFLGVGSQKEVERKQTWSWAGDSGFDDFEAM